MIWGGRQCHQFSWREDQERLTMHIGLGGAIIAVALAGPRREQRGSLDLLLRLERIEGHGVGWR